MRIFWGRMFQAEKIPRSEVGMVLTGYFQMRGRSQEHLQPNKLGCRKNEGRRGDRMLSVSRACRAHHVFQTWEDCAEHQTGVWYDFRLKCPVDNRHKVRNRQFWKTQGRYSMKFHEKKIIELFIPFSDFCHLQCEKGRPTCCFVRMGFQGLSLFGCLQLAIPWY